MVSSFLFIVLGKGPFPTIILEWTSSGRPGTPTDAVLRSPIWVLTWKCINSWPLLEEWKGLKAFSTWRLPPAVPWAWMRINYRRINSLIFGLWGRQPSHLPHMAARLSRHWDLLLLHGLADGGGHFSKSLLCAWASCWVLLKPCVHVPWLTNS